MKPAPWRANTVIGRMSALPVSSMNPASLPAAWVPALTAAPAVDVGIPTGAPRWSLQRRCSLAPAQLGGCLALLVAAAGLVGLAFWFAGAPFVTAFAGLELLAVLVAFALHARHAADGERLWIHDGRLHVERRCGGHVDTAAMNLWALRLVAGPDDEIGLQAGGQRLRVGSLAPRRERQRVLRELRDAVARARDARVE